MYVIIVVCDYAAAALRQLIKFDVPSALLRGRLVNTNCGHDI